MPIMRSSRPTQPVLVVEDQADVREMVELLLQLDGFSVCTAGDGLEALDCIASKQPCLILLDVSMPRMDGITFGRLLRRHPDPHLARTPVILLTALINTIEAEEATQAVEVIPKPIVIERMVQAVERHCGG